MEQFGWVIWAKAAVFEPLEFVVESPKGTASVIGIVNRLSVGVPG